MGNEPLHIVHEPPAEKTSPGLISWWFKQSLL